MEEKPKLIVICKGKSCSKDGANKLLNYLQKQCSNNCKITTKHCFGKCGNGPIVFTLPQQKFYDHVNFEKGLEILNNDNY
ncbi:NAD(P)H-dependent oxidoreductase subunit E [Geminocystis sp. CENA526]|uniref:NAD(P)H-dependent oxidoreductase subunit E n=1 Tax=Geminocystis sp. CENA526 TaxID=1355871 RepID=UPI003D6E6C05